jgi:hypothetical protein
LYINPHFFLHLSQPRRLQTLAKTRWRQFLCHVDSRRWLRPGGASFCATSTPDVGSDPVAPVSAHLNTLRISIHCLSQYIAYLNTLPIPIHCLSQYITYPNTLPISIYAELTEVFTPWLPISVMYSILHLTCTHLTFRARDNPVKSTFPISVM